MFYQLTVYLLMYDEETLFHYLLACRKGTHWKHSVQAYTLNALCNIDRLHTMCLQNVWEFPPYRMFTLRERGKTRFIQAASIDERIIQKALCNEYLVPLLSKSLIYDNGATLSGKGVSFARKRIVQQLAHYYRRYGASGWVLQIDIKGYFASISHDLLLSKLASVIKDQKILALIQNIVLRSEKGLGLGSEVSQILAIWYLNELDHYYKDRCGFKYYQRYMDDIVVICLDKVVLEQALLTTREILSSLQLELNEKKTRITPLEEGFTFLQVRYNMSSSGRIYRKYGKKGGQRMRRRLKEMHRKGLSPEEIRNNYQSWRRSVKKFDADKVIQHTDRAYYKYVLQETL